MTTTDARVEAAAEELAKHDGWISLSHPRPATQNTLREHAAVVLATIDAVDPLRKPRTITTVEEWESLAEGAVIRARDGGLFETAVDPDGNRHWLKAGHASPHTLLGPHEAVVLWEPEAEEEA